MAKYLYDPFGNVISMGGPLVEANLYRFSSKEWHANSGLIHYLYRYYDPTLQRWANRDPIGEVGGINLYAFVHNSPVHTYDLVGLSIGGDGTFGGGLGGPLIKACKAGKEKLREALGEAIGWASHAASEMATQFGLGGKCCADPSSAGEWYVENGEWGWLGPGECTPRGVDCDGMMCNGQFYPNSTGSTLPCNSQTPSCRTPLPIPNPKAPEPPPDPPYPCDLQPIG